MVTVGPEARSFLLNDVTASEREHFEEQVLLDDAFFEDLAVAEDELLEEFARGELEGHEARRMQRRLDSVTAWSPRIAFSRALAKAADTAAGTVVDSSNVVDTSNVTDSNPSPFLVSRTLSNAPTASEPTSSDASLSSHQSAWLRWGTIAATVALALAATWFGSLVRSHQVQVDALETANARLESESLDLESRLREGQTQLSSLESALEQRTAELESARVASKALQEELRFVQSNRPGSKVVPSSAARSLTFVLGLSGLRSETTVPSRVLSEGIEEVKLQLDLEGDTDYSAFRVRVTNPRGEEIWSQDGIPLVDLESGAVVEVTLPATLFQPGRYEISASGHRNSGGLRDVGFYALEIAAR